MYIAQIAPSPTQTPSRNLAKSTFITPQGVAAVVALPSLSLPPEPEEGVPPASQK